MKNSRFSTRLWSGQLILPITAWTLPPLSARYSTLPAEYSLTASGIWGVTVPALGLGIKPLGPRTLPSLETTRIMSGDATATSKAIQHFSIPGTRSSPPALTAPASRALGATSDWQKAMTRLDLPMPLGRLMAPRRFWSDWAGARF